MEELIMITKKSFKIACVVIGAIAGAAAGVASLNSRRTKGSKSMFESCKTRKEILSAIARSASSEGLNVQTILKHVTIEQMEKFNISVDDFILKHYEDPCGVLLTGALSWVSREDVSEEKAKEIEARTAYQDAIWNRAVKVWNMNKADEDDWLTKMLENQAFQNWEQLECWLNNNYDDEGRRRL
jgi:hypothetical protein